MKSFMILLLLLLMAVLNAQTSTGDLLLGNWISPQHDLIVNCYKENSVYRAKIVWFKRYYDNAPDDLNGMPEDKWLNHVVLDNFIYKEHEWIDGTITNLKNGKTYTAYLRMNATGGLEVIGYLYFRIFSETTVFRKYEPSQLPAFN